MKKIDIIYEDKELLVVNKPAKMLTISDGKTNNTLYAMARDYVKKQHKSNKIFIVHRLDKDTSGIVIFAKNENLKKYLQNNWNSITKREYLAIVHGNMPNHKGVIKNYLKETKTHQVYVSHSGEYAETYYEVVRYLTNMTILKIDIKTGKKHQIRVGLSNLGYPIVGDKKYGIKDTFPRLGLHAFYLEIIIYNKKYTFKSEVPMEFKKYMKG